MTKTKGILLGLLSSATFGLIPFFSIPLMQAGMGIPTILFYRFLFSAIIMVPVCLVKEKNLKVNCRELGILFILAASYALTSLGLVWAYSYIPSGITTTIHFLYPILVIAILIIYYKDYKPISVNVFISALLSFFGVALLCRNDGETIKVIGVIIALGTVVTYAIYMVGIEKFFKEKISDIIVTFYLFLLGTFLFGVYALMTTGIESINTCFEWKNLILLALIPTVIADYILILVVNKKYITSTEASILGVMEPVTATCMGVLFFVEQMSAYSYIGILLILVSVLMVFIRKWLLERKWK